MKKKILIIEDSENNLDLCIQILEEQYEVLVARDGEEGVRKAFQERPDLVLMDLSLPKKNGWEATKDMREQGTMIPIVALTAHALLGDKERAIEAGCDDYLSKPFLPEELQNIVKENLKKYENKK